MFWNFCMFVKIIDILVALATIFEENSEIISENHKEREK